MVINGSGEDGIVNSIKGNLLTAVSSTVYFLVFQYSRD